MVTNVDSSLPHILSICTLTEEGPSSQVVTTHHPGHQAILRHPGIAKVTMHKHTQTHAPATSPNDRFNLREPCRFSRHQVQGVLLTQTFWIPRLFSRYLMLIHTYICTCIHIYIYMWWSLYTCIWLFRDDGTSWLIVKYFSHTSTAAEGVSGLTIWGRREAYYQCCMVAPCPFVWCVSLHALQLMEAMYDYDPFVDSPNQAPHLELMFKKGQAITIFGDMVSPGIKSTLSCSFWVVNTSLSIENPIEWWRLLLRGGWRTFWTGTF